MIVKDIIYKNTAYIKMMVVDSTKYPHKNDSRNVGENGIGYGEILLSKNEQGKWNQIHWKSDESVNLKLTRDMAFARLKNSKTY